MPSGASQGGPETIAAAATTRNLKPPSVRALAEGSAAQQNQGDGYGLSLNWSQKSQFGHGVQLTCLAVVEVIYCPEKFVSTSPVNFPRPSLSLVFWTLHLSACSLLCDDRWIQCWK